MTFFGFRLHKKSFMRRKILTVEETFKIKGRGLILAGEFDFNSATIKVGDELIIIRPDGEAVSLSVKGLDCIRREDLSEPPRHLALMVGNVDKEAIPIGSEVFIEE